jgi:hypothetical protein
MTLVLVYVKEHGAVHSTFDQVVLVQLRDLCKKGKCVVYR